MLDGPGEASYPRGHRPRRPEHRNGRTNDRSQQPLPIHTALTPETVGMITGKHIAAMKEGATLINTSRGAVIREPEMVEVLRRRPDLTAVLDVTDPEPPAQDSPLYQLENVFLTPHIAGSTGPECGRMGSYAVKELENYLAGKPPIHGVTREMLRTMA